MVAAALTAVSMEAYVWVKHLVDTVTLAGKLPQSSCRRQDACMTEACRRVGSG